MGTSCKALLFFSSYYDAIQDLKPMQRLEAYDAIFRYGFFGIEPNPSKAFSPLWKLIKPNIDSSIKKRDDGSKGGRSKKTSGFDDSETTGLETGETAGNAISASNKEKEKDKEMDKDKGKGFPGALLPGRSLKRKGTSPAEPVFQSLPDSGRLPGYDGTEVLRKQRLKELEQAAQHTTARPPDDDAETRRLKRQFMQKLNPVPVAAPGMPPADTGTAAASTQTTAHGADQSAAPTLEATQAPQPSGAHAHDQPDTGPAGQEITAQPAPQHPPEEPPAASITPDRCQIGTT